MAPKKAAAPAPGPQPLAGLLSEFAKPSLSADKQQVFQLTKIAITAQDYLRERLADVIADAGDRPVLLSYSSDGTPLRTHIKTTQKVGDLTIRREGKQTLEYLGQVAFARFLDSTITHRSTCVLVPPTPLTHGKTAPAIYFAGRDLARAPRARGHRSLCINH